MRKLIVLVSVMLAQAGPAFADTWTMTRDWAGQVFLSWEMWAIWFDLGIFK